MSIEINKKKQLQQLEHVANLNTYPSRHFNSFCYEDDDDDDEEYTIAITPDLPTEEPDNSLSMGDEHLDTILATESDEVIKSSVEDFVPIPSESEGIFDNMCDVPFCDKNHFDAESILIEYVLNRDNVISSPKIDFLPGEFVGELTLIAQIPLGFVEVDFDPKGDIHFIKKLMYDNSFGRPPKTLKDDSKTVIDSNNDYSSSDNNSL
ncbi:hypothetical protein Tco_0051919 [Tanacetum coccineum]